MHTTIFPGASVHYGRLLFTGGELQSQYKALYLWTPLVCTLCQVFQQAELAGWWVSFKGFVM